MFLVFYDIDYFIFDLFTGVLIDVSLFSFLE